jgi:hypothetical protein
VEMTFNVARNNTSKSSHKIVYLSWTSTSNLIINLKFMADIQCRRFRLD